MGNQDDNTNQPSQPTDSQPDQTPQNVPDTNVKPLEFEYFKKGFVGGFDRDDSE